MVRALAGIQRVGGPGKVNKTRPGNPYLKGALGVAALSVVRRKDTYFWAKYGRITVRRGPMRALVAVEHAMVVAAWHMLTNGEFYREPGPDYFTRCMPAKTQHRAVAQLESLGYKVTLEPLADTA